MSATNGRPVLSLAKILGGALVVFLAISVVQEWDVFKPWILRRQRAEEPPVVSESDRKGAESAVRGFISLAGHFYASGGDTRFTDRMPAAPWLIEELRRDVIYLGRNGRLQDQKLMELRVESVEPAPGPAVIVRTKEYWVIRTLLIHDGRESDPVRSEVVRFRYEVVRREPGWIVQGWEIEEEPDALSPAGSSASPSSPVGGGRP